MKSDANKSELRSEEDVRKLLIKLPAESFRVFEPKDSGKKFTAMVDYIKNQKKSKSPKYGECLL